jgi:hypothetical protein
MLNPLPGELQIWLGLVESRAQRGLQLPVAQIAKVKNLRNDIPCSLHSAPLATWIRKSRSTRSMARAGAMAVIPEGHAIKCRSAQAYKVSLGWSALEIVDAQQMLRGDPLAREGNARDTHRVP